MMFCGTSFPTKKRKHASNTPTPPGAVGTINPKAHDKQKIIKIKTELVWLSKLNTFKQIIKLINFDNTKRISMNNALKGKKEINMIDSSNLYFEFLSFKDLIVLLLKDSKLLKIK